MKKGLRIATLLISLGIMFTLVSCSLKNTENFVGNTTESEGNKATAPLVFNRIPFVLNIEGYTVIYPHKASDNLKSYVMTFCTLLEEYTDIVVSVSDDSAEVGEKEILIGYTNREESNIAIVEFNKYASYNFAICELEGKIAITGVNDRTLIRVLKRFLMNYAAACQQTGSLTFPYGEREIGTINIESAIFENFLEIVPEFESVVSAPISDTNTTVYAYETMIELKYNGEHNGKLIATHASYYGNDGYKIFASDDGRSWERLCTVIDDMTPHKVRSEQQPCLFELPKDMGIFKAGTIFLAGCTRGSINGAVTSDLVLYYSTDIGRTWTAYCNLAHGPTTSAEDFNVSRGVWEPVLFYDDATERVYCFYSDETEPKIGDYVQKLVCKYTTDMENWSETVDIINGDDKNLRPGMLNVAKMGNGEYFMVYEIYSENGCPLYYKTTDSLENFSPDDYGTPIESVDGKRLGSSPCCTWSPVGGECGTLVVVGSHMNEGSAIKGKTDMFISFDYGKTFIAIQNPINIQNAKREMKISYSPHVSFSSDGATLYYLNNSAYDQTRTKVVLSKIKIW